MLGTPIGIVNKEWERARSVVSGRLINGYSKTDWVLALKFKSTRGKIIIINIVVFIIIIITTIIIVVVVVVIVTVVNAAAAVVVDTILHIIWYLEIINNSRITDYFSFY